MQRNLGQISRATVLAIMNNALSPAQAGQNEGYVLEGVHRIRSRLAECKEYCLTYEEEHALNLDMQGILGDSNFNSRLKSLFNDPDHPSYNLKILSLKPDLEFFTNELLRPFILHNSRFGTDVNFKLAPRDIAHTLMAAVSEVNRLNLNSDKNFYFQLFINYPSAINTILKFLTLRPMDRIYFENYEDHIRANLANNTINIVYIYNGLATLVRKLQAASTPEQLIPGRISRNLVNVIFNFSTPTSNFASFLGKLFDHMGVKEFQKVQEHIDLYAPFFNHPAFQETYNKERPVLLNAITIVQFIQKFIDTNPAIAAEIQASYKPTVLSRDEKPLLEKIKYLYHRTLNQIKADDFDPIVKDLTANYGTSLSKKATHVWSALTSIRGPKPLNECELLVTSIHDNSSHNIEAVITTLQNIWNKHRDGKKCTDMDFIQFLNSPSNARNHRFIRTVGFLIHFLTEQQTYFDKNVGVSPVMSELRIGFFNNNKDSECLLSETTLQEILKKLTIYKEKAPISSPAYEAAGAGAGPGTGNYSLFAAASARHPIVNLSREEKAELKRPQLGTGMGLGVDSTEPEISVAAGAGAGAGAVTRDAAVSIRVTAGPGAVVGAAAAAGASVGAGAADADNASVGTIRLQVRS